MSEFDGKLFLITGASSGIGRATSIELASRGARLILVGRNQQALEQTQAKAGKNTVVEVFNLSEVGKIPAWLKALSKQHGQISGLVHAAGMHSIQPLKVLSPDVVEEVLNLNVASALFLSKGLRQKGVAVSVASLVLLSSVVGLVGQVGVSAYSASKGAILALTKSLALELASQNIRVNAVLPGVVNTEMTKTLFEKMHPDQVAVVKAMHPLGLGEPEDVAQAIVFLLSSNSKWMTGSHLVIDGGYLSH